MSSSAYLSHNLIDATGNGPLITIPFDAVTFDDGNCFDLSTGNYIAPGTGTLLITGIIEVANLEPSHRTLAVVIYNKTTGEERYVYAINPFPLQDHVPPWGFMLLPFAETMKCSKGDVFQMILMVFGGPINVKVIGNFKETRLTMNFFE